MATPPRSFDIDVRVGFHMGHVATGQNVLLIHFSVCYSGQQNTGSKWSQHGE